MEDDLEIHYLPLAVRIICCKPGLYFPCIGGMRPDHLTKGNCYQLFIEDHAALANGDNRAAESRSPCSCLNIHKTILLLKAEDHTDVD
jgi:hypothetical protein